MWCRCGKNFFCTTALSVHSARSVRSAARTTCDAWAEVGRWTGRWLVGGVGG
jgi:hypothetical protein